MRKAMIVVAAISIASFLIAAPASAFEGGGRSPSTAPLIEWGQHYAGQLNNHREDANVNSSCCGRDVALWRLPAVSTHDQIVVNWHALPSTYQSGFPVCMMIAQGINDFNWGSVFGSGSCSSPNGYSLSGSGTAASQITLQNTDTGGSTYLEFWSYADEPSMSKELETFPYDFSVEPPRHALTLTFPSVKTVPANGALGASVIGATGLPAPDGLVYTLTANWKEGGTWITTAPSVGGHITFPLALPEAALNTSVRFIVSRAPDGSFQGVESPAVRAKVTNPVPPAPSPACKQATARAHTLSRQYRRLNSHARYAHGQTRRRLRNRARRAHRALGYARSEAAKACGRA
ncbi:MAG TPA: hypothetical protein VGO13_09325 [Solirubrobacterales bacterium]|jgi:hypothetical protein|nr:hypothetical protein [Solirubrobacterales bacterium]